MKKLILCGMFAGAALLAACSDDGDGDDGEGAGGDDGSSSSGGTTNSGSGGSGFGVGGSSTATGGTNPGSGGNSQLPEKCKVNPVPKGGEAVLVDDLEDGDTQVRAVDNRSGYWYAYAGSGSTINFTLVGEGVTDLAPTKDDAHGGEFSMHIAGTAKAWTGAGLGASLVEASQAGSSYLKCPYDVSGFTGVKFWIKSTTTAKIRFNVVTLSTIPQKDLGSCVPQGAKGCYDNFGVTLTGLTGEWQEFEFSFAQLKQEGWGVPAGTEVPADEVTALQWQTVFADANASAEYDVWVDDVEFVK